MIFHLLKNLFYFAIKMRSLRLSLENVYSYEEYIEDGKEDFDWPLLKDDAACGLCYASGTTGNPKGVLYSHKSTILHIWLLLLCQLTKTTLF